MKKVSIARIVIALGIIFTATSVLVGIWIVWGSWITPLERKDLRAAIDEIQAVRRYEGQDSDASRAQIRETQLAVDKCKRQAITEYDARLAMLTEMQFESAVKQQKVARTPIFDPTSKRAIEVIAETDRQSDAMLRSHVQ